MTRWSSHSEAMLQASLDDVDWDMFRASSADVSEFTDVALSFVNMLTDQATETVTIKDILKSETMGGQINPCCGLPTHCRIQRRSSVRKHERVQSIVLCSPTGS